MSWIEHEKHIERIFEFKTQTELAEVVMKLAKLSDELDHHADMEIYQCSKLRVVISSHDSGGLTERDRKWIESVSNIL